MINRRQIGLQLLVFLAFGMLAILAMPKGNAFAFDDKLDPTVGADGRIEQIILPGTELAGKPIEDGDPIVVRVVESFAHGDNFRYEIQFQGLEPGRYDLSKYLQRKDGSSTEGLPSIDVQVKSLLPPGQIEPNALEQGWLPRLGGFSVLVILAVIGWVAVLLGIIFLGRKKSPEIVDATVAVTLADLLRPRLTEAMENRMQAAQYAELERMLFAFWRKKLKLESDPPDRALAKIHADDEAGPLMKQLEQWMHNPVREESVDLSQLLKPYQELPAEASGFVQ